MPARRRHCRSSPTICCRPSALADLSHHAQVIVLSHQRQLIAVARALPAGTVNVCALAA
jgi:hypothetical protein